MRKAHPNVTAACKDMVSHLRDIRNRKPDAVAKAERDWSTTAQLMDCSYLVADTSHAAWRRLDRLVTAVSIACRKASA